MGEKQLDKGFMRQEKKAAHSPQPPGALRLVDVDEVGHHAALQQTALRLHPDLRQQQKNSDSVKNRLDANLQHHNVSFEIHLKSTWCVKNLMYRLKRLSQI